MDYTNSSGFAVDVATGNRMHVTSPVPTEVSEADLNQVNWELMEVIKAAGLTGAAFDKATPATYQKLRTAIQTLVAAPFSASKTASGYQRFAGGLIVQWGGLLVPSGVAAANVDLSFPIAFPTVALTFLATIGVNASDLDSPQDWRALRQQVSYGNPTQTGCEGQAFIESTITAGRSVRWLAIGY